SHGRCSSHENHLTLCHHPPHLGGTSQKHIVLCHAHHPWIAFTADRRDGHAEDFTAPPQWARVLSQVGFGFEVLDHTQLNPPLSALDSSLLSEFEWRQAHHHDTTTQGGVLFNTWD
ncbi:hypothetical protein VSS16_36185, partial [Streptomyces broussonetiae]